MSCPAYTWLIVVSVLVVGVTACSRQAAQESSQAVIRPPKAASITVDGSQRHQTMDGFGTCFPGWKPIPEYTQSRFFDVLAYDLGISIVRCPMPLSAEKVGSGYQFDMKRQIALMTEMKRRGVKRFYGCLWSPPAEMKTNANLTRGGHLRPDKRQDLARYYADWFVYCRDNGIDIEMITLQNEPFFIEPYQSCVYSAEGLRELLRTVMDEFARRKITVKFGIPDDVARPERCTWYIKTIMDDPETSQATLIYGVHNLRDAREAAQLKEGVKAYGRPVWNTEGHSKHTNNLESQMHLVKAIHNEFANGDLSAWTLWDPENHCRPDKLDTTYFSKKHFSRFIQPGAVRVGARCDDPDVLVSAYHHPVTGDLAAVLINTAAEPRDVDLTLENLKWAKLDIYRTSREENCQKVGALEPRGPSSLQMPAQSIVTLYSGNVEPWKASGLEPLVSYPPATAPAEERPAEKYTPLQSAAFLGEYEKVEALLKENADVKAAGPGGWTALHCVNACVYEFPSPQAQVGELAPNMDTAGPATRRARKPADQKHQALRTLDLLLAARPDVNARAADGWTPLHVAAANGHVLWVDDPAMPARRIEVQAKAGADPNARDTNGRTPLHFAAWTGELRGQETHADVVAALIRHGADVNAKDHAGRTPLHYAAAEGYTRIVEALLKAGADRQCKDQDGKTPLEFVGTRSVRQVIGLLRAN